MQPLICVYLAVLCDIMLRALVDITPSGMLSETTGVVKTQLMCQGLTWY